MRREHPIKKQPERVHDIPTLYNAVMMAHHCFSLGGPQFGRRHDNYYCPTMSRTCYRSQTIAWGHIKPVKLNTDVRVSANWKRYLYSRTVIDVREEGDRRDIKFLHMTLGLFKWESEWHFMITDGPFPGEEAWLDREWTYGQTTI